MDMGAAAHKLHQESTCKPPGVFLELSDIPEISTGPRRLEGLMALGITPKREGPKSVMDGQAHSEKGTSYKKQMLMRIDLLRVGNGKLPQDGDPLKQWLKSVVLDSDTAGIKPWLALAFSV